MSCVNCADPTLACVSVYSYWFQPLRMLFTWYVETSTRTLLGVDWRVRVRERSTAIVTDPGTIGERSGTTVWPRPAIALPTIRPFAYRSTRAPGRAFATIAYVEFWSSGERSKLPTARATEKSAATIGGWPPDSYRVHRLLLWSAYGAPGRKVPFLAWPMGDVGKRPTVSTGAAPALTVEDEVRRERDADDDDRDADGLRVDPARDLR